MLIELQKVLEQTFKCDEFRPHQLEVAQKLLNKQDVIAVLPTSAGKSLCYQLPAVLLDGVTLVISPLIALMKDQVRKLKELNISGAYINSDLSPEQLHTAYERGKKGWYKIIYVSPERLTSQDFINMVKYIKISMVIVDEAHCVLAWGDSFRTQYSRIENFIEQLPIRPVVGAFTATLSRTAVPELIEKMSLQSPSVIYHYEIKENLHIEAINLCKEKRREYIKQYVANKVKDKGIVYCLTCVETDELHKELLDAGIDCVKYHGSMNADDKAISYRKFIEDYNIMVATKAFGMGIDLPNISYIINNGMPENIEAYVQQIGRAGRDGSAAEAVLLYSSQDYDLMSFLLRQGTYRARGTFSQKQQILDRELKKLNWMYEYCQALSCRQSYLKSYFEERESTACCLQCDNCLRY